MVEPTTPATQLLARAAWGTEKLFQHITWMSWMSWQKLVVLKVFRRFHQESCTTWEDYVVFHCIPPYACGAELDS